MSTIRQEKLDNGLQIVFVDESNRYFGDYHRICIIATVLCTLSELAVESSDDEIFLSKAIEKLGAELRVVKRFERMGVPSADVDAVRNSMIDDFLKSASPYLNRPEYPRLLIDAEMKKRPTHSFYG